jgi:transcriptional regulator with XRE-family HTH domain
MTIEQAAGAADVSKSAFSRIENGVIGARVPVLRALLDAYEIPTEQQRPLIQLAREAREAGWWQRYSVEFDDGKALQQTRGLRQVETVSPANETTTIRHGAIRVGVGRTGSVDREP